ncbi:XRE family transcriptional regulator [Rhodoferax sp. GW822-FHT02A01]|uniref:helix-turn-helix domain-containing protein n=1 Tax=Rhodoferax sp. GW822-FHT02A01 TaxID=3141537 RepID=UPI00315CF246
MKEVTPIHQRIAEALRLQRAERGLSLEALAQATGVSRSALSLIERGQSSPTAIVLDKIAAGLGITLGKLFEQSGRSTDVPVTPLARRAEQVTWTDPGSGYVRRAVSPRNFPSSVQLVDVEFPPGARVAFETVSPTPHFHQQVWILSGEMTLVIGEDSWHLKTGDCLAMTLEQPTVFYNPTDRVSRYCVVMVSGIYS